MSVNFRSACLFSIAIGKRMREAGIGGSIIFVTSILGTERGLFPGTAVSGASIAAVNYLTRVKFSLSLFLTHIYKCVHMYV